MAHFAKIIDGIVDSVIVAEQAFIDTLEGKWVQASYNTRRGVHYGPDGKPDEGTPLRKNYPGKGYIYDSVRDAFYLPKPQPSFVLNEGSCVWEPPVPYPSVTDDHIYTWDESTVAWVKVAIII
jgi:hypothetical protein